MLLYNLRYFLAFIALTMVVTGIQAKTVVSGVVATNSGKPIDSATVIIDGTKSSTFTNPKGKFKFTVESGAVVLFASKAGLTSRFQSLKLEDGTKTLDSIFLFPDPSKVGNYLLIGDSLFSMEFVQPDFKVSQSTGMYPFEKTVVVNTSSCLVVPQGNIVMISVSPGSGYVHNVPKLYRVVDDGVVAKYGDTGGSGDVSWLAKPILNPDQVEIYLGYFPTHNELKELQSRYLSAGREFDQNGWFSSNHSFQMASPELKMGTYVWNGSFGMGDAQQFGRLFVFKVDTIKSAVFPRAK